MWWLALGVVAGCALVQPPVAPDLARPDPDRLDAARARLDDAETLSARRLALVDLVASVGVTPLAGGAAPDDLRRYALGAPDSLVGGFVPGRHPVARGELVTVRTDVGGAAAVELLEASRILVQRSMVENVPSRSLLVAFQSTTDPLTADARPLAQGIETALWVSARVHARARLEPSRLRVTYPASDSTRADSTITLEIPQTDPLDRVDALVAHLLRLTTPVDTRPDGAPAPMRSPPARPDRP